MSTITQIIITVLGSGALFSFLTFLIQRKDKKNDRIKDLEDKVQKGFEEREEKSKALCGAIDQLTENVKSNQETINVVADGVVGIIHNTIICSTQPIINRGAVTYEELSTLDSLYIPYRKLGGNSECTRRYDDVCKLPKITEEEALNRDREIAAAG